MRATRGASDREGRRGVKHGRAAHSEQETDRLSVSGDRPSGCHMRRPQQVQLPLSTWDTRIACGTPSLACGTHAHATTPLAMRVVQCRRPRRTRSRRRCCAARRGVLVKVRGKMSGRSVRDASGSRGRIGGGARCMPRDRGRGTRPVAVSLAREDHTRTPRWRARAKNCVLRRGRGGWFQDLVKRMKNRRRASRACSKGPFGHAQPVGNARHARRCLARLVRGARSGR